MNAGWLLPPRLADAETTRSAAVVHWILLSTLAAVLFALALAPVVYPQPGLPWALFAAVLIAIVGSLVALRRGRVRAASASFLGVAWLVTVTATISHGGVRGPAILGLPVLVLMAGFLHSARAAMAMAMASGAVATAVLLGERAGLLSPPGEVVGPMRYWLPLVIVLAMTAAMVRLALGAIGAALQEARASERRFAEMIEVSPDGMVMVDAHGVVESINPAAVRIANMPAEDIVGRPFLELGLLPGEDQPWAAATLPRALDGRFEGPQDLEVLRRDGVRVPIEVRVRRVVRSDGSAWLQATMRDQSERRRIERERAELEARLLQAQKLEGIGRLAGGVAHDFNNYLTMILGNVELLAEHLPSTGEAAEILASIEKAAELSADLTRRLLAFSRKQILQPRVLDLNALVARIQPMVRRILREDVQLEFHGTENLGHVRADPAQLETVLVNLIVNARDAMPSGGVLSIETRDVHLEAGDARLEPGLSPGDYVLLSLSDTGHGMDAPTRQHIFEPFFTTKGAKGVGLGLASVYGIVSQSGGSIAVDSEPGRGSCFRILLPRVAEALDAEREAPARSGEPQSRGTILLVEDEAGVRATAHAALTAQGFGVVPASDGREAISLLEEPTADFDLVVSDVVMPGMGGTELVDRLRQLRPGLPVLLISGYAEQDRVMEYLASPDVDLLQKPFTASTLVERVRRLLA